MPSPPKRGQICDIPTPPIVERLLQYKSTGHTALHSSLSYNHNSHCSNPTSRVIRYNLVEKTTPLPRHAQDGPPHLSSKLETLKRWRWCRETVEPRKRWTAMSSINTSAGRKPAEHRGASFGFTRSGGWRFNPWPARNAVVDIASLSRGVLAKAGTLEWRGQWRGRRRA